MRAWRPRDSGFEPDYSPNLQPLIPMIKPSFASLALFLVACQCPSTSEAPMASMVASQSAGYAVPAGAGDVAFTTSASMAAVVWSQLTERQLADWHQIWTMAQRKVAPPIQCYTDASGTTVDLFSASPRDGFCVAFAQDSAGDLRDAGISGFLRSL